MVGKNFQKSKKVFKYQDLINFHDTVDSFQKSLDPTEKQLLAFRIFIANQLDIPLKELMPSKVAEFSRSYDFYYTSEDSPSEFRDITVSKKFLRSSFLIKRDLNSYKDILRANIINTHIDVPSIDSRMLKLLESPSTPEGKQARKAVFKLVYHGYENQDLNKHCPSLVKSAKDKLEWDNMSWFRRMFKIISDVIYGVIHFGEKSYNWVMGIKKNQHEPVPQNAPVTEKVFKAEQFNQNSRKEKVEERKPRTFDLISRFKKTLKVKEKNKENDCRQGKNKENDCIQGNRSVHTGGRYGYGAPTKKCTGRYD